ncbi:MAG: penicillin-binding transpeptidase domain-containing protein [Bdellovibrionota bacterium]
MTRLRLMILFAGFSLCSALLIFRAFQLQIIPSKNVQRLAGRQLQKTVEIVGRRGAIRDRKGRELAVSVNTSSIYVNPQLIKNMRKVSTELAMILGVPTEKVYERLQKSRAKKFLWLERQLDHTQMARLKQVKMEDLEGVGILPEFRRDYPHASLAAHVLGYVSIDGKGLAGLEYTLNDELSGGKRSFVVQRDARSRPIFSQMDQIRLEDMRGTDLNLSLDLSLQGRVEKILQEAVQRHEADSALAIVMNPQTGEILSLANSPNFDLNHVNLSTPDQRRNRAVTDPFEPGSVVKAFVVAKALEDKVVTPATMISGGGGTIQIGKHTIHEADKKHRFDQVSVRDLIRFSSNVATVNLMRKMGFPRVADIYKKIGFGETTGLSLPAESRGIFRVPAANQLLEQATMSFGHGIATTPIQITAAYAILANGGYRVKPRLTLVDKSEVAAVKGERIFSESTIKQVREILERVVEDEGTGTLAKINGYRAAGKTGTAVKIDPRNGGYMSGAYWSSFAGFFPSQNPEIVVYVMVDHPRKEGKYGGAVAAPLFADIVKSYMGVGAAPMPSMIARRTTEGDKVDTKHQVTLGEDPMKQALSTLGKKIMPDLVGLSLTEALRVLEDESRPVEILRAGRVVEEQLPAAGQATATGDLVRLRLR